MIDKDLPSINVQEINIKQLEKELPLIDKKVTFAGRIWKEIREGTLTLLKSIKANQWIFPETKDEKIQRSLKTIETNHISIIEALKKEREIIKGHTAFPTKDFKLRNDVANRIYRMQKLLGRIDIKELSEENKNYLNGLKDQLRKTFKDYIP